MSLFFIDYEVTFIQLYDGWELPNVAIYNGQFLRSQRLFASTTLTLPPRRLVAFDSTFSVLFIKSSIVIRLNFYCGLIWKPCASLKVPHE